MGRWKRMNCAVLMLATMIVAGATNQPDEGSKVETVAELPDCSPQKISLRELMNQNDIYIVSTLDGKVTALDVNNKGQILWTYQTNEDGLLKSTIGEFQFMSDAMYFKLVPALDGSLYKLNEKMNILEPIPLNAEVLLKSTFKIGDDLLITGGKEVKTYALNLLSGDLLYSCGISDCTKYQKGPENNSASNIILITQLRQKVRAVNPRTGDEQWKFDVGENNASILAVDENCKAFEQKEDDSNEPEESLLLKIPDGVIGVITENGDGVWSHDLNSPITALWRYKNGKLKTVDLFDYDLLHTNQILSGPALYFGVHNDQFYIQHSEHSRGRYRELAKLTGPNGFAHKYIPQIDWQSTKGESSSNMQVALLPSKALSLPINRGAFIYLQDFDSENQCKPPKEDKFYNLSTDQDPYNETESYSTMKSFEQIIYPFKQVFVVSGMIAIFLNIMFSYFRKWYKKRRLVVHSSSQSITPSPTVYESITPQQLTEPPPNHDSVNRTRSSDSGSENILPFISRYSSDFEPISCIGKGGFGVVFEARNKIDDCLYAIKRINLPLQKAARDKVMREVRALASLEHQGIVRYYNSWLESPPEGWQEKVDSQLLPDKSSLWSTGLRSNPASESDFGSIPNSPLKDPFFNEPFRHLQQISENDSYIVFQQSSQAANNNDLEDEGMEVSKTEKKNKCTEKEEKPVNGQSAFLYIQMQLCQKNTLREWLKSTKDREKTVVLDYFLQIVEAVEYVHSKQLMHRDLKPSNIFFAMDGCIKIGDFGLVTDNTVDIFNFSGGDGTIKELTKPRGRIEKTHSNQVGTRLYMSPEQVSGAKYSNKVDIYSLGVILFEMLVSFDTEMERIKVLTNVREGFFPESFEKDHPKEHQLVKSLLSKNPNERPEAEKIIDDPIFIEMDSDFVFERIPRKRSHSSSKAY
ncbi:eukaryotic translation initiation factor 2-alpha kinase 3-like [Brevipalpus obovatus]|uniref:eukaryotic translation initiation factor 2-alpha kinase 3-like n=1 Tax=Brevipalpus obovatus TaxID=246614 RepID=UPI003D9F413C